MWRSWLFAKLVGVLVLASGCDMVLGVNSFSKTPRHRKPITITQPFASPLTDFPVSIVVADDPELAALAKFETDVAFTDADGVALDCEIVSYDAGNLEAWVRVPALPPAGMTIEMVYGTGAGSCTGAATWGPFIGVWHEPDASGVFHDRTLHGHDTSPGGNATAPSVVAGIVGNAGSFNGVTDGTCAPVDADQSLRLGTTSFSFSVWVDVAHSAGSDDVALSKGGQNAMNPGFDLELGTGIWIAKVSDGSTTKTVQFAMETETLDQWIQLVVVVDRATPAITAFTNGVLRDSQPLSVGSVSGLAQFCLGKPPSSQFEGVLDEPRVYSVALTSDWIAAEYANLTARAAFMTIGSDEPY